MQANYRPCNHGRHKPKGISAVETTVLAVGAQKKSAGQT
jgi:hypothetical protein